MVTARGFGGSVSNCIVMVILKKIDRNMPSTVIPITLASNLISHLSRVSIRASFNNDKLSRYRTAHQVTLHHFKNGLGDFRGAVKGNQFHGTGQAHEIVQAIEGDRMHLAAGIATGENNKFWRAFFHLLNPSRQKVSNTISKKRIFYSNFFPTF